MRFPLGNVDLLGLLSIIAAVVLFFFRVWGSGSLVSERSFVCFSGLYEIYLNP